MFNMMKRCVFVVLVFLSVISLRGDVPADEQASQFSYQYDTEIAYNHEPGFKLDPSAERIAFLLNNQLNLATFFEPSLIADPKKMREYHLKKKPATQLTGKIYDIYTEDDVRLGTTLFDRDSDTLLLVAGGFTNAREMMSPFVAMFGGYDIGLFDFRGHGYRPFSIRDPNTWPLNFVRDVLRFPIDNTLVQFGREEDKDVIAVVSYLNYLKFKKTGKLYKRVIGLGICYGAFILLKTAAENPGFFDKIVLDGCWLSLSLFVEKIKRDLKTLDNPQTGGWADHWFFGNDCVKDTIEWIGRKVLDLTDISLLDYTHKIKNMPLLFFFGKDDYMVTRGEFETLWNSLDTEKTVVITSNAHVRNHLKQKELYKLICDLFIESSQERLISYLKNSKALAEKCSQQIQNLCELPVETLRETPVFVR